MGRFVNPDNGAFYVALNSEIYVDKTQLLEYTNKVLDSKQAMICNSRPRRFGKSVTADMLAAYYSKGAGSRNMFEGFKISSSQDFEKHLNKYDVIHFDVQWFMMASGQQNNFTEYIQNTIVDELKETYPGILKEATVSLPMALSCISEALSRKFIVIIDEWDAPVRDEVSESRLQDEYINFLRAMFKGTEPTKYIKLAYLTGILPIKKIKTQSALNNFDEFTMLDAGNFAPYIGFTEEEVRKLCNKYGRDFDKVKLWYDGYVLGDYEVYNPKAVVSLMMRGDFQSYWTQTGTYESIVPLINMDFDGLKSAIVDMAAGARVKVKTGGYQNDMVTFRNKDDVLTLMIHLGYLAYDKENKEAFVPNEEIRSELINVLDDEHWNEFVALKVKSDELLRATLDGDGDIVAEYIETIHSDFASAISYNNENSLSSVLSIAYLGAMQYYYKPIREMPAGLGFADVIFIPKKASASLPAMVIELKWNKSADTALFQIKNKKYTCALSDYEGDILLVGISYDKKTKKHECKIEKIEK